MTEVVIKAVVPYAEYDGIIYSYKVTCILNNFKEVIFIDEKPFDLTGLVGKKIVIKLATSFISEKSICLNLFEGEIRYSNLFNEYNFVNDEITISVSKEIVEYSNIKLEIKKEYCFEDLILKNWKFMEKANCQ